MGDWPRLVNLRRCARGLIADSGEATNTTVALTNNSLGPELILVWQVTAPISDGEFVGLSYQNKLQMTPGGVIAPLVPGDAVPPGILQSGDQASLFAADFWMPAAYPAPMWPATFPLAVLQPGWSLAVQTNAVDTAPLTVCFFWEGILSKYFDRVHTMAQIELDILAEST